MHLVTLAQLAQLDLLDLLGPLDLKATKELLATQGQLDPLVLKEHQER